MVSRSPQSPLQIGPPARPLPPRRRRWLTPVMLGLLVLLGIAWYLHHGSAETGASGGHGGKGGAAGNLQTVGIATAQTGPLEIELIGLGTVTPRTTVTVTSQIDGQLMALHFQEGQLVKAGELLAELDDRPAQATLAEAQGNLLRDQGLLANARLDLDRYKLLLSQDSIAKQVYDTQVSLVQQYQGAVRTDQGTAAAARVTIAYSHIHAPISGRVGLRHVDPGNIIHAADAGGLVTITELQPIDVLFALPAADLGPVMQRQPATVTAATPAQGLPVAAWDRSNQHALASGTLVAVDNAVDVSTGTVMFKAQFPNTDNALFPHQFVNARLLLEHRDAALMVPAGAVQQGAQDAYVYVVTRATSGTEPKAAAAVDTSATSSKKHGHGGAEGGGWMVSVRPVTVGPAQDDSISILSGLTTGEVVVSDGADKLRDGAKVLLPGQAREGQGGGQRGQQGVPTGADGPAAAPGVAGKSSQPSADLMPASPTPTTAGPTALVTATVAAPTATTLPGSGGSADDTTTPARHHHQGPNTTPNNGGAGGGNGTAH